MRLRLLLLCAAISSPFPLFARDKTDVIAMKNGDRITCEIKGLQSNTLYISVDYILSDLTGVFCTSRGEREFTRRTAGNAQQKVQSGTDRDVAAAD